MRACSEGGCMREEDECMWEKGDCMCSECVCKCAGTCGIEEYTETGREGIAPAGGVE